MSEKDSKTIGKSIEETRRYHLLYLRAINNPLRRRILRAIKDGSTTIEDLRSSTGLDTDSLKWHLSVLEHGFCLEKNIRDGKTVYKITQEGKVIDHME
ncbi:MAG: winged helix-turn-helix domain-containing protein, partial [Candidatus Bathyarchaeota archaeon]|nr:winged helix-turn-helix domain-containing protein [Candidatus Bathyarchaeota archaeon]